MRLGFACHWDPEPRGTWSGTPWRLRHALTQRADVVDVGVSFVAPARMALKLAHARYRHGTLSSTWKHSRVTDALRRRRIAAAADDADCDAVLEIQDLAVLDRPFFVYQDLSYDALLHHFDVEAAAGQFPGLTPRLVAARRDRQRHVYEQAAGVIAMSDWLARSLVRLSGLPAEKVVAIPPGANATSQAPPPAERAAASGDRGRDRPPALLFLGKDFQRKGGDLAVAAVAKLRADYDPELTLTVAGPVAWPLPGPPPDGVRFAGRVAPDAVTALIDQHDLLVLPSRFEAFGIAFVEALARGVPCIARDAFAMPEIVHPGRGGALLAADEERPDVLARTVVDVLEDAELRRRCAQDSARVRDFYTWDRAAEAFVAAIERASVR